MNITQKARLDLKKKMDLEELGKAALFFLSFFFFLTICNLTSLFLATTTASLRTPSIDVYL